MTFNITLPSKSGTNENFVLPTENNIVLIGSNGAGKSRLGSWIEEHNQQQMNVHRISAQKVLNIPDYARILNLEQAERDLIFGSPDQPGNLRNKMTYRWQRQPSTWLLNDYDKLLSLLFAKSAERNREHTLQTRNTQTYIPVPDDPIDIITKIWTYIMPHRQISFKDGKVLVQKEDEPEYHGKEMSDGERVALYFIGQYLCTPENSIIIIDEPEIHLHKSLIDKLWNKIEELAQNKLIIYITHDLDFASSRTDSQKYWIKSYNGNNSWIWEEVPIDENLPDGLTLEILGNRKNIIFTEGENGSLDSTIYQLVYPEFHIIPRGGGEKVIDATKALRENKSFHHLNAFGIIDSDYKEEEEKVAILGHGIHTIAVAEIENLFCIEPVLRIIAQYLQLNADEKVNKVITFLCDSLNDEFEVQVSSKVEKIIEYKLCAFSKEGNNRKGLEDGLRTTLDRIDIVKIYEETEVKYRDAIDERNLQKLLLLYNRKSLPDRISGIFGLRNKEYGMLLIRLMKGVKKTELVEAFKQVLPEIR